MNKTAFIVGGTGGIGEACVKLFAKNGYNVALGYFSNNKKADELSSSTLSSVNSIKTFQLDVTDFAAVKNAVNEVNNALGSIDVLVNAFGIAQQKLYTEITDDDWDKMIATNLKGVFNCIKAVLPAMIHNKYGKIINISSMWGVVGASMEVHYSAAKAGIIGLTKALSKEVAPSNINVNCICPGIIDTKMNSNINKEDINEFVDSQVPLGRIGQPEDIANAVLFLSSDKSSYITGQAINIDGGVCI